MRVRPLSLKQANAFIEQHHRHHKKVQGHRFSIRAEKNGVPVGICVVGRPVARACDQWLVAEVTRLATDGTKNACSFLYAAAARACRELGYQKIQTYILDSETGVSLEAAGWVLEAQTAGGQWVRSEPGQVRRTDQPTCRKLRYAKYLNP